MKRLAAVILAISFISACTKSPSPPQVAGKKLLMVIAPADFRDEELLVPKAYFEGLGVSVTVAGDNASETRGMLGARITPDISVGDADAADYDTVIFVGGAGVDSFHTYDDPRYLRIAKSAAENGKIIGAICLGPKIPANAGVLAGKRVTAFDSEDFLESKGALYTGSRIERDGNVITADGPGSARAFAELIAQALSE